MYKITEQTNDRLVLKISPLWIIWAVLPLIIFHAWVIFISAFNEFPGIKLECNRLEPTPKVQIECQYSRLGLFPQSIDRISVSDPLRGAEVQKIIEQEDSNTYRLFLLTSSRKIHLRGVNNPNRARGLINSFVRNYNQPTLTIEEKRNWRMLIEGLIYPLFLLPCVAIGLLVTKWTTYKFDKNTGKVIISSINILRQSHSLVYNSSSSLRNPLVRVI